MRVRAVSVVSCVLCGYVVVPERERVRLRVGAAVAGPGAWLSVGLRLTHTAPWPSAPQHHSPLSQRTCALNTHTHHPRSPPALSSSPSVVHPLPCMLFRFTSQLPPSILLPPLFSTAPAVVHTALFLHSCHSSQATMCLSLLLFPPTVTTSLSSSSVSTLTHPTHRLLAANG